MSRLNGEGRAPNEKSQTYIDPNYRRQKRAEARALKRRFDTLCSEVTVTRFTPVT